MFHGKVQAAAADARRLAGVSWRLAFGCACANKSPSVSLSCHRAARSRLWLRASSSASVSSSIASAVRMAASMASLEQAHTDALRKQLYLERLVQPNLPDIAIEPRRIRNVLSTLALGLVAFGILTLLLAGVREHRD